MEYTRRDVRQHRRFMVRFGRTSSFTADVGRGGFSVQLMRVLPVASPLEGSIIVEGRALPFAGQVAWARPGDPHLGLHGRMGVRLTRVPRDYRQRLDSLGLGERSPGSLIAPHRVSEGLAWGDPPAPPGRRPAACDRPG